MSTTKGRPGSVLRFNVLPAAVLRSVSASWPGVDWSGWHRYKGDTADKYGLLHVSLLPEACREAIRLLALIMADAIGDSFIDYDLHAAGLHQIPPGGFLGRHQDAERHPIRPWVRTHSIVLFLDDFQEEDGGKLVLEPDVHITPKANMAVVFETPKVWHYVQRTAETAPMRRTLALFAWAESRSFEGATAAKFEA